MRATTRRKFLGSLCAGAAAPALFAKKKRPAPDKNVLWIVARGLRPDLGAYGDRLVSSPNIDRLAERGLTFERAYCQQAAEVPSRASTMLGVRPETVRVNEPDGELRVGGSDGAGPLPRWFREHGYRTARFGDVLGGSGVWGEARSARGRSDSTTRSWAALDAADAELTDGETAIAAAQALRESKRREGLFFFAVGFDKPGLPFTAPRSYFDLYPEGGFRPPEPTTPEGAPDFALHDSSELRSFGDVPAEGPIPPDKAAELIRAYYSSVSFLDAQVGLLLDALEESGAADSTVVALHGDRGYHLGEHGLWTDGTNYEVSVRAPLIMSYPSQPGAGRKTSALVELVDLYPSLCHACNVPIPEGLEGAAFTPLFENPERLWKRAAFSQHPREIPNVGPGMGHAMRTSRFRYVEWTAPGSPFRAAELYDYREEAVETRNIANRLEHSSLVNGLAGMLREGWRASLPPTDPRSGANS